jgi:hypothetical protein
MSSLLNKILRAGEEGQHLKLFRFVLKDQLTPRKGSQICIRESQVVRMILAEVNIHQSKFEQFKGKGCQLTTLPSLVCFSVTVCVFPSHRAVRQLNSFDYNCRTQSAGIV